jgi:hypothetical protein
MFELIPKLAAGVILLQHRLLIVSVSLLLQVLHLYLVYLLNPFHQDNCSWDVAAVHAHGAHVEGLLVNEPVDELVLTYCHALALVVFDYAEEVLSNQELADQLPVVLTIEESA